MNAARSLLYVVWLYGGLALVGAALFPFALVHPGAARLAVRAWSGWGVWGARWICGIKVVVRGRAHVPPGQVLFAAKHQAMLDTLLPFTLLGAPSLVIKAELEQMPIYGWYAVRSGMIPVARDTHASALKAMLRAARARAAEGRSIFIFPEGTRQPLGAAPDYKPGVAALYRDLGLPCVPIALNSGLCWPPSGLVRRPGTVVFEFLPPIPPGLPREAFMTELETKIETASEALLPPALRRPTAPATAP